jgi:hypothetical protein
VGANDISMQADELALAARPPPPPPDGHNFILVKTGGGYTWTARTMLGA